MIPSIGIIRLSEVLLILKLKDSDLSLEINRGTPKRIGTETAA